MGKYFDSMFWFVAIVVLVVMLGDMVEIDADSLNLAVVSVAAILVFIFLCIGIEIGEQKEGRKKLGQPVKFKDLKAGFYEVVSYGYLDPSRCDRTDRCTVKFLVLESPEEIEFLIEVSIAQRLGIERVLGEIVRGTKLKINKKGQIEKV